MTITAFPSRNEYTATAGQTIFNYTFKIFAASELDVYITPVGQEADDDADLTTAYTVDPGTIGDEDGGFITLDAGVNAGDKVTIISGIPYNRTVDYQNSGDFLPDTVNGDNDRQVAQIKQLEDLVGRTVLFQRSLQNATELSLPNPVAGLFLRWKTDLSGLENTGVPTIILATESFDTVSDMVGSNDLVAGNVVQTLGYYSQADGGDNLYLIENDIGQPIDGGLYILLANGLVAKGIFPKNYYTPLQWGAVRDGVTDASPEIQIALDAVIGIDGGRLHFPAGDYLMNSVVSFTSDNLEFMISGDGVEVTRFIVPGTNTDGVFDFTFTQRLSQMTFKDFTALADGLGCGTAIKLTQPEGGNRHNRTVYINRVEVKGNDITQDYFNTGINLTGAWRPLLDAVIVGGPYGPGVSDDLSNTSPLYYADVGINVDDCYSFFVNNSYVWSAKIGISSQSSGASEEEGGRVINTNIVGVRTGVIYTRTAQEPGLRVVDNHINSRDYGIRLDGAKFVRIAGNLMYNEDISEEFTGTPIDMFLENTSAIDIEGNIFQFAGSSKRINVSVLADPNADDITIRGNIFTSLADTAIRIALSATNLVVMGNQYVGAITTKIDDLSGNASILERFGDSRTGVQSSSDGAVVGPIFELYRDSGTPADFDDIGAISFVGKNSAIQDYEYAQMKTMIGDSSDGTESSQVSILTSLNGALEERFKVGDAIVSPQTSLFIERNNGVERTLERVTMGAADSGGAGFRLLKVPN